MKRKEPALPDVTPDTKKAKTDQSVRFKWRLAVVGTESRAKGAKSQGVIDPEDAVKKNGNPRNFMVRGDGAYKFGEDGKVLKPTKRYKQVDTLDGSLECLPPAH